MPPKESEFDSFNRLLEITRGLDTRGLALSLAAYAEEALGDLLAAYMRQGESAEALLHGFNAPLGNFSARTKAALALGLITSQQSGNLERLRKIRNVFAHSWEPLSVSDQRIASHITALEYSPLVSEFPETPEAKLRAVSAAVLTEIRSLTGRIEKGRLGARMVGCNLIPGVSSQHPDTLSACESALEAIRAELPTSTGERKAFLHSQKDRWLTLLEIMRRGADADKSEAIEGLIQLYRVT